MKKVIKALVASTILSATVSLNTAFANDTLVCNPAICKALDANAMKTNKTAEERGYQFLKYNYAIADELSTQFNRNKTKLTQRLNERQDAELVKFVETISTQQALNTIYYYTHVPSADVIQLSMRFSKAGKALSSATLQTSDQRRALWLKVMNEFEAEQNAWLAKSPGSSWGTKFLHTHALNAMYSAFEEEEGTKVLSIKEAGDFMTSISETLMLLQQAERKASNR